jgi:branched-chain amino acid transport system substrate-binding protein
VAVACGLLAACGTRLPDEAFVEARDGVVAEGVAAGSSSAGSPSAAGPRGSSAPTATTTPGAAAPGAVPGGAPTDPGAPGGATAAGQAAGPNQASDVGVTETTLRIGTIVAENGVLGNVFQPAVTGLRSWVEQVNADGGIGGRTIELFTCDDREDRARTLECARRLVEQDQVFALIATNTRALGGASQYLADQGIPVLGNPINNAFYRFPNFFTVYGSPYVRDGSTVGHDGQIASYSTQYRWFRENLGATKAAVFSYDIAESAQAGDFLEAGLEAEGFQVSRYVVSFAAPSFDAAVAEMQRNGTELVFDAMDTGANIRLCDAIARRGFEIRAKVSTIPVMGASFGEQFNDACRPVGFVITDTRPFTDTSHPLVARYNEAMGRYQRGRELHQWGLEAWAMGEMLRGALEAMGPAPTRQGFMDHLLGYRRNDVGGLMTPTIQWVPNDPPLDAPTVRDCIGVNRWDDGAGGWVNAAPFPFCIDDAKQFFTSVAEQGT